MNPLHAPWRLQYVKKDRNQGCPFCPGGYDSPFYIDHNDHVVVFMNQFPYANGHVLILPVRHIQDPSECSADEIMAMHQAQTKACEILRDWMHPHGFNIGTNLGEAAGAGIAGHLHRHVVPRWQGDVNFMPVMADVKVIPDHIEASAVEFKHRWNSA